MVTAHPDPTQTSLPLLEITRKAVAVAVAAIAAAELQVAAGAAR